MGDKSSPKELKFWGDEDDDFKNTSPKDFNKSPHGLRGIVGNRSKSGVFTRTQKCRFERARESKEICTKKNGVDSHKELREPLQIHSSWTHKRKTKIHHKELMRRTELNENKRPEGTRREGPPFPSISVQNPHKSLTKNPSPREERERKGTGRRGAHGKGSPCAVLAKEERKRERR